MLSRHFLLCVSLPSHTLRRKKGSANHSDVFTDSQLPDRFLAWLSIAQTKEWGFYVPEHYLAVLRQLSAACSLPSAFKCFMLPAFSSDFQTKRALCPKQPNDLLRHMGNTRNCGTGVFPVRWGLGRDLDQSESHLTHVCRAFVGARWLHRTAFQLCGCPWGFGFRFESSEEGANSCFPHGWDSEARVANVRRA